MKIKRFFAAEMREAIRQVKAELGADAVILSNNKVDGGVELVAAIDYDEDAVKQSLLNNQPKQPSRTVTPSPSKKRSVLAKVRNTSTNLADEIEDDVISFSHQKKSAGLADASPSHASNKQFSELFKQSSQSVKLKNSETEKTKSSNHNIYSKTAIKDRKQPYISDFGDLEEVEQSPDNDDPYPFDYESLAKEQQKRQENLHQDDFFSQGLQYERQPDSETHLTRAMSKQSQSDSVEWIQDPALNSMQEEIKSLRGILENQLSGLAWGSYSRSNPHSAELLSRLYRLGLKSSLSEKIVKRLKKTETESLEDSWRRVLSIIARNIPIAKGDFLDEGGVVALVGPTGVGKTTNIAKLAARFTLKYGAKNLALVTTDSYRVGAHEQLKTYGRILGVPVYTANDEEELKQVLIRLEDKRLVLIDTAGMSHRDLRLAEQLNMLRNSDNNMKILAVLSAASQTLAMDEVIKTFNAKKIDGCIASKVDESTSIGGIISILIENQLELNYISDGQKVPEDIHRANTTDLLKQALEMVRQHPVAVNSDELAISYSAGELAHAAG